jgi:hypothetical protein
MLTEITYSRQLSLGLIISEPSNPIYEDIASKFFEVCITTNHLTQKHQNSPFGIQHFIFIADAMTYEVGDRKDSLWNEQDGMYYDAIVFSPDNSMQLPVGSLVGLIQLYATLVLKPGVINWFPGFKKRMEWFIDNRPEVSGRNMANMEGSHSS